ncbi:DUF4124 domain-containing protein [Marinobacter litoralis]|uniref:DUF4124 domain-containing protein n=1 Tax=Marinobacter litoralis TaxID=187981 RepID=UPI0018EA8AE8|nr:DUF4124 domain-containing protein [Marinobacter litoralis]MBJ6138747.1 DUF4124 domain-containing protein [Marinobacter litoralis]
MKALITLASGMLLLTASTCWAEVYRHVDAQGNVTYSDEPMKGGETVKVKPVTTITLPKPEAVREPQKLREEVKRKGASYDDLGFAYPQDDQAFHSGNGTVTFEVRSTPGLKPGHKYEITLDGQPVGQSTSGSVTVPNIDRGTHNAAVHIVDRDGVQVKTGKPIRFTVHRPSIAR